MLGEMLERGRTVGSTGDGSWGEERLLKVLLQCWGLELWDAGDSGLLVTTNF